MRVFRFAYFAPRDRNTKGHRIFQLRDGAAFSELAFTLVQQSKTAIEYGGLILNYPPSDPLADPSNPNTWLSIDTTFEEGDVLIVPTCPPYDYLMGNSSDSLPRRVVDPGYSSLEKRLFGILGEYFQSLNPRNIRLTDSIIQAFESQLGGRRYHLLNRADLTFGLNYPNRGLLELARNPHNHDNIELFKGRRKSTVYFLYTKVDREEWPSGPGYIMVCFGLTGEISLIMAYAIRTRFPHFVQSPRFVLAEVSQPDIPKRPADLHFSDDWEIEILLDLPL